MKNPNNKIHNAMWVGLVVTAIILGAILLAYIKPYNDVRIEDYGPIQTAEFSEAGTPVIREGFPVVFPVDFCVNDLNALRIEIWYDYYGALLDATGQTLVESKEIEDGTITPTFSTRFETTVLPDLKTGCKTVALPARLPVDLQSGSGTYAIRHVFSYRPNPFRKIIIVRETEPFYLLGKGQKIPDDSE